MIQPDAGKRSAFLKKAVARARAEAPLSTQTAIFEVARGAGVVAESATAEPAPTAKSPEAPPPVAPEVEDDDPPEIVPDDDADEPAPRAGKQPKAGKQPAKKKGEPEPAAEDALPDAPAKRDPASG